MANKIKNKQLIITQDFTVGGYKITNLGNPTDNTDAVTLQYLTDNFTYSLSGLTDVTIDTPEDQQILRYSGGTWVNSNDYWTEDVSGNTITPTNVDLDVQLNSIVIKEDAGAVTIIDMSVSDNPPASTEESYSFDIDGTSMLKIYSEADGTGGIENTGVVIGADYQYFGDPNTDGSWRFRKQGNRLRVEKRAGGQWGATGIFT
jgi:hypothetical protein